MFINVLCIQTIAKDFFQQIIFRRAPVTMNIIVDPKKSHQKRSQKD